MFCVMISPPLAVRVILPPYSSDIESKLSILKNPILPTVKLTPLISTLRPSVLIVSAISIWKLPLPLPSASAVNVIVPLPLARLKRLSLKGLMVISFVAWNIRFVFPDNPSNLVLSIVALSSSPMVRFLVSSNNVSTE